MLLLVLSGVLVVGAVAARVFEARALARLERLHRASLRRLETARDAARWAQKTVPTTPRVDAEAYRAELVRAGWTEVAPGQWMGPARAED
jgi:hypothetical protein